MRIGPTRVVVTAAVLVAAPFLIAAKPTVATSPTTPGWGAGQPDGRIHRVVFHTRDDWQRRRRGAASVNSGSGQLSYGGGIDGIGVTTGPPRVYVVFWGSQWGTTSTDANGNLNLSNDASGVAPPIQQLLRGLGVNSEQWSGVMTQYCEGVDFGAVSCPPTSAHVGYPAGGAFAGAWADESGAAPASASVTQLATEAVSAASHFGNTTPTSNRDAQYIVVSPTGTHPDGFNSTGNFCAWHSATSSSFGDIAFTNLPYITDAGASCGENYVNAGAAGLLDGVTIVLGHEYAETITDQLPPGGWTDSAGFETADKCAWVGVGGTGGAQNVSFSTGRFPMQATWSNDGSSCEISHSIVAAGVISAVGASTTERVMDAVLSGTNQYDVHAVQAPSVTVPGDQYCGTVTYAATAGTGVVASPDGADPGRDALKGSVAGTYPSASADAGGGCVDVARSEAGPRPVGSGGDNATFQYFAYALDAVTWASASLQAPPSMTLQQLQNIYNCVITSWSSLPGGGTGPIQRALPPVGSGIRDVFLTNVLGVSASYTFPTGPSCPPPITTTENTGQELFFGTNGVGAGLYQQVIVPYSAGAWVFQAMHSTNPTVDVRAGLRPGSLTVSQGTGTVGASTVDWTGSDWTLNNATVVGPNAHVVSASTTTGSTTVTAPAGTFVTSDVGKVADSPNLYAGTQVTAVSSDGSQVTILPGAAVTGSATVAVGYPVVSEHNPNVTNPADTSMYAGVHYLYNVVDTTSPSYPTAATLVGFGDVSGGTQSALCAGSDSTEIVDFGFLDLAPQTSPGGNVGVTCRLVHP